jgi:hypothetical protein
LAAHVKQVRYGLGQMDVNQLLVQRPLLQRDQFGQPAYWAVAEDVAKLLDAELKPGSQTLETGAGVSTVIFAMKGAHHTCVVPDADLVDRIVAFCQNASIETKNVTFEIGNSEVVLPRLKPTNLDLVLIDGGHAFPIPFIDWFFAARMGLREGGTLVIDDTQLWTGRTLVDFLRCEPNWILERELVRSAVLSRRGTPFGGDWAGQLFVVYGTDVGTAIRMKDSIAALRKLIPDGSQFIAVDESQLKLESLGVFERRRLLPFPENNRPPEESTAVRDLELLLNGGASFLVIFWTAFGWLDHNAEFARYINRRFVRLLADDRLIVFDLRKNATAPGEDADRAGSRL